MRWKMTALAAVVAAALVLACGNEYGIREKRKRVTAVQQTAELAVLGDPAFGEGRVSLKPYGAGR